MIVNVRLIGAVYTSGRSQHFTPDQSESSLGNNNNPVFKNIYPSCRTCAMLQSFAYLKQFKGKEL